jgi:pimeloyl-ACP methyl ester carboxylesterase
MRPPPSAGHRFSDRIPDVRTHLVADASHFAHLERPHEVHELLTTFVAQHDGP